MSRAYVTKVFTAILVLGFLMGLSGCGSNGKGEGTYTKEDISAFLDSQQDVTQAKWSPDAKKVVYLKKEKVNGQEKGTAYLWTSGEKSGLMVGELSSAVIDFKWSPDSKYFLMSGQEENGCLTKIIKADNRIEEPVRIKSFEVPSWSPDSTALAYAYEERPIDVTWGTLEIYTLGDKNSNYLWKTIGYQYEVSGWDKDGYINYTEVDKQGTVKQKKAQNIKPGIAGVHLGDIKEQVIKALGRGYIETISGEELLNFSESVYRWDYSTGYTVLIGKTSGKVLEIRATAPQAETNLGVKVGDRADQVFAVYRPDYIEPESMHGGKLSGVFKVEGTAALFFNFDLQEGQSRQDIQSESKVESMVLTYPELMDDSF